MKPISQSPELTGVSTVAVPPPSPRGRLLAICNVDLMAWLLLRPWLAGLQNAGYEVHVACARGEYWGNLAGMGFHMHDVAIQRSFLPWLHVRPFFQLRRLLATGGFTAVNTHSAVGAAIGRFAAAFTSCRPIIYTVHGFLFHENMPALPRSLLIGMEWLLGQITSAFMFVSQEDTRMAVSTGIVPAGARSITIFNGVDLDLFSPKETCPERALNFKRAAGVDDTTPVVGIIGRIVREKGYREFLEMAKRISPHRKVAFLVVGDTLASDRDQFGPDFRNEVRQAGLAGQFVFTGHTNQVADYLRIMDVFVLPSHREGFPRSIIEAMSAGLPVVTTDIRGCREAVVDGETGLIVPAKNGSALADAIERLLANPAEAAAMGRAGRTRAVERYDYRIVQQRFVQFVDQVVSANSPGARAASSSRSHPV